MLYRNQIKIFIILAACFFILPACKKFLDKKQNDAEVVPSTLTDVQALMDNAELTGYISPSYPEASSDEYYLSDAIFNSFPTVYQEFYLWQKPTVPDGSSNDWGDSYHAIYDANLALDLLNSIDRGATNGQQWDNVKGSALFFRAYHFLNLLWEYAKAYDSTTADKDFGIALRLTSDFNVPSTRATNQQSYNQVISDAKASLPLLPAYPFVLTRPSKTAAYGLLARCYLSMRDYKNALLYSDSCLQLNNNLIDFNADDDIVGNLLADAPFKKFNKETIFYCEMNYEYDIFTYTGFVDSTLVSSYQLNDLRKVAYLSNDGTGHFYFKAPYTGSSYINFTGIATDEMYLTRAECYIRIGEIQKGLNDLNSLLAKRYKTGTYTPLVGLSQNVALAKVLMERKKELLFRGNRWMDIKRLNKEGANIVLERIVGGQKYTLQPNAGFYAIPLPDDIVKITGMPQN